MKVPWRIRNKEKLRVGALAYYYENKEKCLAANKHWRTANPEMLRENRKKSYRKNPDRVINSNLKRRFGITLKDYENLLLVQEGACKLCRRVPDKKRLAIDHNHATGEIRGLLCAKCNTALGLFGEDTEVLMRCIEYIKGN